jgi:transposase
MPANSPRTPTAKTRPFFSYSEDDMMRAIDAVRNQGMSKKKAASQFNVPRATLIRKIQGKVPETRKMGPPAVLTFAEEILLEKWALASAISNQ